MTRLATCAVCLLLAFMPAGNGAVAQTASVNVTNVSSK